jgi:3-hydroxy-5-methyl-1-naphthoate 3-O-methyltransferase
MAESITPEPLLQMMNGLWLAQTLAVSVELEIYDKVADGMNTIDKIAISLNTTHRPIGALLNACVAMGLLEKTEGTYKNSELASSFLIKDASGYYGDFIKMISTRSFVTWKALKESILTNSPQEGTLGEAFLHDPQFAILFTKAMHNNSVGPAAVLASLVDLSRHRRVLDLGGGSGIYSIMLAKQNPHIEAVVFDFPMVCEVTNEYIQQFNASSQVSTLEGNFLEDKIPKDFDVVILSQILHGYSPEECGRILGLAKQAMKSKGLLIVNEFCMDDDKTGPLFPALFALNMVVGSKGGNSYSSEELHQMLETNGFHEIRTRRLLGPMSLITAEKRGNRQRHAARDR